MQTALVARLALAALAATPILASGLTAQDASDVFTSAPRLRVATNESDKPMLGVMVSDTEDGVLIEDVLDGTLADQVGLQPGDLLLKLGGQTLDTYTDIGDILAGIGAGGHVGMTVVREGEGLVKLDGNLPAPEPEPEEVEDEWVADAVRGGGFLGVELGDGGHGVTVAGVIANTAAWFAGLETGDVLTHIDGTTLDDNDDLIGAVSSKAPGTMIAIGYDRDGVKSKTHVRLGHRSPMTLPGMPGQPHGLFVPGQDAPGGGMHFQLHGDQNGQLPGMQGLHEHLQKLHEDFEFDGGEHQVKIKIEDGVMTIDRDGDIEVHELEGTAGLHDMGVEHLFGQGGNSQIAIFGADGELHGLEGLAALEELEGLEGLAVLESLEGLEGLADLADIHVEMTECADAIAIECAEIAAECEALAAECAEIAVECEAKADCQVEVECAEIAECEEVAECEVECDEADEADDDDAVL